MSTLRPIVAGEMLTVDYTRGGVGVMQLPLDERREMLWLRAGFECACSRCQREERARKEPQQRSCTGPSHLPTVLVPSCCRVCGGPLASTWIFDDRVEAQISGSCSGNGANAKVACARTDPSGLLILSAFTLCGCENGCDVG